MNDESCIVIFWTVLIVCFVPNCCFAKGSIEINYPEKFWSDKESTTVVVGWCLGLLQKHQAHKEKVALTEEEGDSIRLLTNVDELVPPFNSHKGKGKKLVKGVTRDVFFWIDNNEKLNYLINILDSKEIQNIPSVEAKLKSQYTNEANQWISNELKAILNEGFNQARTQEVSAFIDKLIQVNSSGETKELNEEGKKLLQDAFSNRVNDPKMKAFERLFDTSSKSCLRGSNCFPSRRRVSSVEYFSKVDEVNIKD
ncbi:MAG: hypothetical protein OXE99_00260 [Cellvibrionales bacterium]|nr:hypothetical protein [Cellvibrionales bacterium]